MKRLALFGLAVVLLLSSSRTLAAEFKDARVSAYVTTLALNLRSGPGVKNRLVGVLLKYDPVTVTDHARVGRTTWYAVDTAGGYTNGWVSGNYIAFGEPPIGFESDVDYGKPETPTLVKGPFKYIGVAGCKKCHEKSTGKFPQGAYTVWKQQLHASAFQALKRPYTKVIAKRRRDVDDPTTDWRCVKCHQAAYGADPSQLAPTYRAEDGVTCEVCHGPGSGYANVDHGPSNPERYKLGFMKLVDLDEREALCTRCHNPASPTYKPFNLQVFSQTILHWVDPNDAAYVQFAKRESRRREEAVARKKLELAKQERTPAPAKEKAAAPTMEKKPAATTAPAPPTAQATATKEKPAPAKEKPTVTMVPVMPTAVLTKPPKPVEQKAAAPTAPPTATATRPPAPSATPTKDMGAERTKTAAAQRTQEAAAEAALKQQKEAEAAERKRQQEEAAAAQASAKQATGLDKYLVGLPDVFTLNKDGEKYKTVRFTHAAHSAKGYVPGVTCQTCHHTQKGDKKPEKCMKCHDIGGDADETKKKTKAVHDKEASYPKQPDQEGVSCRGCHEAQNALLEDGKRSGKKAPTKCTGCHKRK